MCLFKSKHADSSASVNVRYLPLMVGLATPSFAIAKYLVSPTSGRMVEPGDDLVGDSGVGGNMLTSQWAGVVDQEWVARPKR